MAGSFGKHQRNIFDTLIFRSVLLLLFVLFFIAAHPAETEKVDHGKPKLVLMCVSEEFHSRDTLCRDHSCDGANCLLRESIREEGVAVFKSCTRLRKITFRQNAVPLRTPSRNSNV